MEVNDKSPDFNTTDENGKEVASKDFRGKTVVLYFYPNDDTPGCTIEACEFGKQHPKFSKHQARYDSGPALPGCNKRCTSIGFSRSVRRVKFSSLARA